ncbi:MAG: septal ring lytic transglycosylase RlpA family protein [Bryobacteraceae bacterium]
MAERFVEGRAGVVTPQAWHVRPLQPLRHGGLVTKLLAVALIAAVFGGCARKKHVRRTAPPAAPAPAPRIGDTETGLASWYGHPYHGRAAADGEIYDMETMVAAHRTLPFNTVVRVLNVANSKSVDVRIIDRGPFVDARIIDLSHAAARAIDLLGPGVGPVRLEVIRLPETMEPGVFAVQVGAFRSRDNAERLRSDMAVRYGSARVVVKQGNPDLWRVLVGTEATMDAAGALAARIHAETGENNGFVVRLDSE